MAVEDAAWLVLLELGCSYKRDNWFHYVYDALGSQLATGLSQRDAVFNAYEELFGEPHPDSLLQTLP